MITVMDMDTGKILEAWFGAFEDEVLNAEWQPARPELPRLEPALAVHEFTTGPNRIVDLDPEGYLGQFYRCQA